MSFGAPEGRPATRAIALLLLSAGGLSLSLTLVFLGMRAVMDIGGACASGGPFVPVQPCPDGVGLLMMLGIFGLFGFGALGFVAGVRVGGPWAALPLLAWPALFLSLGWNFLEYGFWPPSGTGWEWSWIFCGVVFVLMGGIPLVIGIRANGEFSGGSAVVARQFGLPVVPGTAGEGTEPSVSFAWDVSHRSDPAAPDVLVDQLERLAALRRRGDLTNEQFEAAKAVLLAGTAEPPA